MAYSRSPYTGNGAQTQYAVTFPFLDRTHVSVTINGVATTAFTWISDSLIQFNVAPANGAAIVILRSSSRAARMQSYTDGQALTEESMDNDALQLFYVAQEAFDAISAAGPGGGDLVSALNLSDVSNAAAARANLGVVAKSGDTLTGFLTAHADPTSPLHVATKAYVDAAVGGGVDAVLKSANLGDLANRQAALDTLTAAAGATANQVLTRDASGNAVWATPVTGGAGEVNTMTSAGGTSWYKTKVGADLQIKGVSVDATLVVTPNTNDNQLKVNLANAFAWTERHDFGKSAAADLPTVKIASLKNGAMPSSGATINTGFEAAADIRMTTRAATDPTAANKPGGIHALYVQHDITGIANSDARLFGGIRSQVTGAATGAVATEYTAFYGNAQNNGSAANYAWSFFCDTVHNNSNVNAKTFGYASEVIRQNANGSVYAYMAQVMDASTSAPTAAFMVAKQSSTAGKKFTVGFGIGDAVNFGEVDYGLDMAYATINAAAIRIPSLNHIVMSGTDANTRSLVWNSSGETMEFQYGGSYRFKIPLMANASATHAFEIKTGSGTSGGKGFVEANVTDGAATPRNPQGYVRMKLDGVFKRFAYYSDT